MLELIYIENSMNESSYCNNDKSRIWSVRISGKFFAKLRRKPQAIQALMLRVDSCIICVSKTLQALVLHVVARSPQRREAFNWPQPVKHERLANIIWCWYFWFHIWIWRELPFFLVLLGRNAVDSICEYRLGANAWNIHNNNNNIDIGKNTSNWCGWNSQYIWTNVK